MAIKRAAKKFLTEVKQNRTPTKRKPTAKMIDQNEIENIIREQAYRLYEQRGYTHGADLDDWIKAERIVTKG